MSETDPHGLLRRSEWTQGLAPALLDRLAALAVLRRVGDGELIYGRGDEPEGLYGVVNGRVRLSLVAPDGREILAALTEPGGWFGVISMLGGIRRAYDAHAVGEGEILLLPRASFQRLLDREPLLYRGLALLLCQWLAQSFGYIEDLMFLPLSARLAKRLLDLAQIYGEATPAGTRIRLRLPQEDLARMLGTSRQSVSQQLKRWEARGWIKLAYGTVVIRDRAVLQKVVTAENRAV